VPIWAAFMKVATKGDKSEWFERPSNVVGVNVCRVSGKLPNYGCANVQSVDEYGYVETKSMIYMDYFVKGTQPTTTCPVHSTMFTDVAASAPVSIPTGERATLPTPPVQGTTGASPAPFPTSPITGGTVENKPEPEKEKKKGFWRRIFGGGDKKESKDSKDSKDPKNTKDPKKPGGAV
jgi:hypothetical protein